MGAIEQKTLSRAEDISKIESGGVLTRREAIKKLGILAGTLGLGAFFGSAIASEGTSNKLRGIIEKTDPENIGEEVISYVLKSMMAFSAMVDSQRKAGANIASEPDQKSTFFADPKSPDILHMGIRNDTKSDWLIVMGGKEDKGDWVQVWSIPGNLNGDLIKLFELGNRPDF